MRRVLRFQALDGEDVSFPVPRKVNHFLALKAIESAHKFGDAAISDLGLTRAEVEFVAEVIATLEGHRKAAAS